MTNHELNEKVRLHGLWFRGESGGSRAYLSRANLSGANLSGANLSRANLYGANLSRADLSRANLSRADLSGADLSGANLFGANLSMADLSGADLSGADLSWADLSRANLSGANLSGANLSWANLSGADLSGADLSRADLSRADLSRADLFRADLDHTEIIHRYSIVPDVGSFTAFKKVLCDKTDKPVILTLEVPSTAKRIGGLIGRKCRVSKALVVNMETCDGKQFAGRCRAYYDKTFKYNLNAFVEVENFCDDPKDECMPGIHVFITRREAVDYIF